MFFKEWSLIRRTFKGLVLHKNALSWNTRKLFKNLKSQLYWFFFVKNLITVILWRLIGIQSFDLPMGYSTESELMHHNCLVFRRGIGGLNVLGDISQSKYALLQNTSNKRRIKGLNNSRFLNEERKLRAKEN